MSYKKIWFCVCVCVYIATMQIQKHNLNLLTTKQNQLT